MKNFILTILLGFVGLAAVNAQTMDELKAMQAEKQAAADALVAEAADLQKQIDEFPGWKIGGVGIAGFDLNGNDNWFALNLPNSKSTGYGVSLGAFANLDRDNYFWRNLGNLTLKQVNTTLDATVDTLTEVSNITDALDISSLFGYKLNDKWAISAEGKYISTLLNFNNPGQLTLSAGATWTPINNLVVVIHPLGYQFNFPGDSFVSSVGAKIGATYAAEIIPGVSWSSNLSMFVPYGDGSGTLNQFELADDNTIFTPKFTTNIIGSADVAYSSADLFNWTWINSFSTSLFKGIGVGFNIGLRSDKQVANQAQYNSSRGLFDFANADNPLQMYYTLGLSYNF